MNIGIDIDNVISNFDEELYKEYKMHDKKLRNSGVVNQNADYIRKGMFDWTDAEEKNFYINNIERIAKNLKLISNASKYINKLRKEGNKIFIISGRNNGEYADPYNMTKEWLNKNNVVYDKLFLTNAYEHHEKAEICLANNVEIMIDDSASVCAECSNVNIKVLLFDTKYNRKEKNFKRVNSWKEVYEYVRGNKINVILDTDTANECDDEFALSYLIKSQEKINIEAITVAPYSHKTNRVVTVKEGQDLSYNEILKLCKWLNFDTTNKVFRGALDYIHNRIF